MAKWHIVRRYMAGIESGKITAGKLECAAVERHRRDLVGRPQARPGVSAQGRPAGDPTSSRKSCGTRRASGPGSRSF